MDVGERKVAQLSRMTGGVVYKIYHSRRQQRESQRAKRIQRHYQPSAAGRGQRRSLAVGKEAVALVKAPWVMLMTDSSDIRLSARNCLEGKVTSVTDGAVNAEVVIKLDGGSEVYSIVTREAVAELGLATGVSAMAVIKASHIILGVPA